MADEKPQAFGSRPLDRYVFGRATLGAERVRPDENAVPLPLPFPHIRLRLEYGSSIHLGTLQDQTFEAQALIDHFLTRTKAPIEAWHDA